MPSTALAIAFPFRCMTGIDWATLKAICLQQRFRYRFMAMEKSTLTTDKYVVMCRLSIEIF